MQKKISLSFNSSWVLSKKDNDKLPVEAFVDSVKGILEVEVLDTSLTDCELIINQENASEDDIANEIVSLIKKVFSIDDLSEVVQYEISDYVSNMDLPVAETEEPKVEALENVETVDEVSEIINKINSLIGAEEFKALADECVKIAPGLIKHNTIEAFTHQCYIFAINDCNG